MTFNAINVLVQQFAETNMGETFSYTPQIGSAVTGLVGVFNQVSQDFVFEDAGIRKNTNYTVVSSKAQWGATVPANTGFITDSAGIQYACEDISGTNSAGEPAYEITLKRLT